MELKSISELRKKYLGDIPRSSLNSYKQMDADARNRLIAMEKCNIADIEGNAKQSGEVLDSTWSQYSYEEILQMEENGVVIPKEILALAHAEQDNDATTYEIAINEAEQEQSIEDENSIQQSDDTATKKSSFFELIAKASAKIDLSEEKQEQIKQAINELNPIANQAEDTKSKFLKDQKNALEKLKDIVKEWQDIKEKANKGEKLTPAEEKRYEELSQLFESQSQENKNITNSATDEIKEITKSLREIDALAQKGSQIGAETEDLGNQLIDFTGKNSAKATSKTISQDIGIIGAMIAMALGKRTANEAVTVGSNTQVFANDTQITLNEVATILDIQKPLSIAEAPSEDKEKDNQEQTQNLQNNEIQNTTEEKEQVKTDTETRKDNEQLAGKTINNIADKINIAPTDTTNRVGKSSVSTGNSSTGSMQQNSAGSKEIAQEAASQSKKSNNNKSKTKKENDEFQNLNASNGKQAANQLKGETPSAKNSSKETEKQSREMEKCDRETQKTDKQLKKDEKTLQKQLKKDQKTLKDNEKKVEETTKKMEQEQAEIEAMQLEVMALEEAMAMEAQNGSNSAPAASPAPAAYNSNPNMQSDSAANRTTAFTVNPGANLNQQNNNNSSKAENTLSRIEALQTGMVSKSASLELGGQKLYRLQNSSNKTIRRMKKTNTQYNKAVKETQKKLKEDQQEESKVLKFANKVESICSPIATAGMIVKTTGQILSKIVLPPWIPVVGAVMVPVGATAEAVGNYGVAAANITKTVCYALDGNLIGALMSAGSAIMSGASAVSATKQATAGFQNLSKNIAGAQTRAATAQAAKEAAKQGASKQTVEAMKNGASKEFANMSKEELTNGMKESLKEGASKATKEAGTSYGFELMKRSGYEAATKGINELGKASLTELAMNLGSTMGTLGQMLQKDQPTEEEKAKNTNKIRKSQRNMERFYQIKRSNDTQRVGFANYYSRSNSGGGLNKKR